MEAPINIASIEAAIREKKEEADDDDIPLEKRAEQEVAQMWKYTTEVLGPAVYRWWMNRFFAQLNTGAGGVVEFTYMPDGGAIGKIEVIHARELQNKYAEMRNELNEWLQDPKHRRIQGVVFFVRPEDKKWGYVNTFSGLPVAPINPGASLVEPELARVTELLERIWWHMRVILSNGDEAPCNFLRKFLAFVIQGRGKTRMFLQFWSEGFQGGKGALNAGFLGEILGKYHYVPTAHAIDSPNGLVGRFNWPYQRKLCVVLDEMGHVIFNKKAIGDMRAFLCAEQVDYKQEGKAPVAMRDYAYVIANTNVALAINVESNGDAQNAVFPIDERYTKEYAGKGYIVEGEPMTFERKSSYFSELYEAFDDPAVQSAFVHEMNAEECAAFNFQANIPRNELRESLAEANDDRSWRGRFLGDWRAGRIAIRERTVGINTGSYDTEERTEKDYIKADEECEAPKLFQFVKLGAREENVDENELNCRDHRQFGLREKLNKRPGLSGRPHCKGVAIGVARRGGRRSGERTLRIPPRAVFQSATPADRTSRRSFVGRPCVLARLDFERRRRRARAGY